MVAARASRAGSFLLLGAAAALVLPTLPPTSWADPPPAGSACTITGTVGPNTLTGTSGDDVICGLGGDDIINGLGGDDLVIGGGGNDTIEGGPGKDDLRGGPGTDTIRGGDDDDVLYGGPDADDLGGGAGADRLLGDGGDDVLGGGDDADELRGDVGADTITGGAGDDDLFGGDGDDDLQGELGLDRLVAGAGNDTLAGGDDADVLRGGDGDDTHSGGDGDDVINDRDGAPYVDDVTCGLGTDTANVDSFDTVDVDCDTRRILDREDPVANDDTRTVNEDSTGTTLPVLNNDTDADGGPIRIDAVTQGTFGSVVKFPRKVTYTPNADYCNHPPSTNLDTFTYTLAPGGDTATVSVRVTCIDDSPVAVDDTPSVAQDAAATTIDVLANDTDVDGGPISISSFTPPTDGTVVITNGGANLTYEPSSGFCNNPPGTTTDDFTYTLAPGGDVGAVKVLVDCAATNTDPVADDESFTTAIGNTVFVVDDPTDGAPPATGPRKTITGDVLDGDTDAETPESLAVTADTITTADGGQVVIQTDGDFVYTPATGTSCTDTSDSFDYELSDGNGGTDTGTVSIAIAGCVWYVNNEATAGGDGASGTPFDTLTEAESASAANSTIFVYEGDGAGTGYGGDGLVLKAGQDLVGEYVGLTIGADTLVPASPLLPPILSATNADVVTLDSGNTVAGLFLDPSGTGGGIAGGAGDNGGTVTKVMVSDTGTAGTQPMVELDGVSGDWDLSGISANNTGAVGTTSGSVGIRLNNTTGTITFTDLDATPDPLENNSFQTTGAKAFDATNATNVSGKVFTRVVTSADGGVRLDNVSGAGLTFNGMSVTTTGGTGFSATSSGPITITNGGGNNLINSAAGRALVVQDTNIGSGNLAFRSISASGGTAGIVLNNTGNLGRLSVSGGSGTCTNADTSGCSGGVIASTTVTADDTSSTPTSTGIVLNNTLNPSFTRMWIHDHANYGIRGNNVAGFTLSTSVINGANGTNAISNDASVRFTNLSGTASITGSHVAGGWSDNLAVVNSSGTVNLTLSTTTFAPATTSGTAVPVNDAVHLETTGTAALSVTTSNLEVNSAGDELFEVDHQGSGTGAVNIADSTFANGHTAIQDGEGGVRVVSGASAGHHEVVVQSSIFRGAKGNMVTFGKDEPADVGPSTMDVSFSGNAVGLNGVPSSASQLGSGVTFMNAGQGTLTFSAVGNFIRQYNNHGILVQAGHGGTAQSGTVNATITNNTIDQPGEFAGTEAIVQQGIHLNIGTITNDSFFTCAAISGNNVASSADDSGTGVDADIRLRQRFSTTIRLPGYGGASNDNNAVDIFLSGINTVAGEPGVLASNTVGSGGSGFVGGAACPTP